MRRLRLILIALVAICTLGIPAAALADGDPGSDVLYYQNLFVGGNDGVSADQQVELGHLLDATTALGARVHLAIIGQRQDLGYYANTSLWGDPAAYARFLGSELALEYSGRLIVVMPQGAAVYWHGHGSSATPLNVKSGTSAGQLYAAAASAVDQVESSGGVSLTKLHQTATSADVTQSAASASAASGPTAAIASTPGSAAGSTVARSSGSSVSPVVIVVGLLVIFSSVFWAPALWRRRRTMASTGAGVLKESGVAVSGLVVGVGALAALVIVAVVLHSSGSTTSAVGETLAKNPYIFGITSLGGTKEAPPISLTDEIGQQVNLKQYRGKVVLLSFTDSECQTICPLTTQAMVDARDSLGVAKKDVVLLGVNANPKSTSIEDVNSYTQLHGLLGQWHFLTGTTPQLRQVWDEYHVADDIGSGIIDHSPALYIIGPDGKVAASTTTYANYGAIPQFGQELAQEASKLLPAHPSVQTHYTYNAVNGISPSTKTTLRTVNGGTVTLGTGKPHLYLFIATWDTESTPLRSKMEQLNSYARDAKRLGLPPLTVIDEASVEPNPQALTKFLKGMNLDYPVAIDETGQVADGYNVQGEPWFVLASPEAKNTVTNPTATTPWTQEVYTEGWPSLSNLEASVKAALKPATAVTIAKNVARQLAGSPPKLAALHRQSSRILSGGAVALAKRLAHLRGTPVVVNIWASWCAPCKREFGYLAAASAKYGSKIAFLGVDYDDQTPAAQQFLATHKVSYPSYSLPKGDIPSSLLPGGVSGTPETAIIAPNGQLAYTQVGSYQSLQQLEQQIESDAYGTS